MFKKILWTSLAIISAIIVFIAVWPIPQSQWSGLVIGAYPTGNEDKTLAEQLGYSKNDIILILHADDLAIHKDQTDGALDAMKRGMVKTGSVMVPCPDFERVASIWKDTPYLDLSGVDIPYYASNEFWLPHNTNYLKAITVLQKIIQKTIKNE